MKTRTLLFLALGCGLMIMLAGAVFLFQLASQDDVVAPVEIGAEAEVGDMVVAVMASGERDGVLEVEVSIGGVVDDDVTDDFRLIASGRAVDAGAGAAVDVGAIDACGATTVDVQSCVVRFDVSAADGSSRVLFFERGDERARWVLA
jgi:hypothetical protein